MSSNAHVVAVCGSLRDDSKTRVALREALRAARGEGATTTLVDLRNYELPPMDADRSDRGDAEALRDRVGAADAVLLGTPNYHGSYSAVLKNALDYCGRDEFSGSTVGLLEVAGGDFPGRPIDHLGGVCRTLNAWTLPLEVGIPDSSSTVSAEGIEDESVARRTRRLGRMAVRFAGVERYPELSEAPRAVTGD